PLESRKLDSRNSLQLRVRQLTALLGHLLPHVGCHLVKYRTQGRVDVIDALNIAAITGTVAVLDQHSDRNTSGVDNSTVQPVDREISRLVYDLVVPTGGSVSIIYRRSRAESRDANRTILIQHLELLSLLHSLQKCLRL